jgi:hypothetical protein
MSICREANLVKIRCVVARRCAEEEIDGHLFDESAWWTMLAARSDHLLVHDEPIYHLVGNHRRFSLIAPV